jgi:hypothetical protein
MQSSIPLQTQKKKQTEKRIVKDSSKVTRVDHPL